ncbi:MAG: hypothetical protein EAZ19_10065 [Oscillatoriales cyanobacterium]|nr:MAG: hypothetical protein EAZ49_02950 [Oscillatoriales cyanobacterium]TAG71346.1 MAG: hypothetical protein EAZ23_18710 [Oscillatoriales cyanobacterium]TAG96094.1 MAG: hypothetical protein EAZ19_10065 [Oscillatoriales cyanobacterium]
MGIGNWELGIGHWALGIGEHLSFAFTVLSPLAYCTIRERGQHYNKKNAFYKTEMLPGIGH